MDEISMIVLEAEPIENGEGGVTKERP